MDIWGPGRPEPFCEATLARVGPEGVAGEPRIQARGQGVARVTWLTDGQK